MNILRQVLPYLLAASIFGIAVEYITPAKLLTGLDLNDNLVGLTLIILIGVPVYFCNGADILFLNPLIYYTGLRLGTAMAFSLTSTSVCLSSLIMLVKFLGKKLTFILLLNVIIVSFIIGLLINIAQ